MAMFCQWWWCYADVPPLWLCRVQIHLSICQAGVSFVRFMDHLFYSCISFWLALVCQDTVIVMTPLTASCCIMPHCESIPYHLYGSSDQLSPLPHLSSVNHASSSQVDQNLASVNILWTVDLSVTAGFPPVMSAHSACLNAPADCSTVWSLLSSHGLWNWIKCSFSWHSVCLFFWLHKQTVMPALPCNLSREVSPASKVQAADKNSGCAESQILMRKQEHNSCGLC